MKNKKLCEKLDLMIKNPRCELNYHTDYEFLIAVMLSAQCTDKMVNKVTENLFKKYSLKQISTLPLKTIEDEIRSLGSYTKKAYYLQNIAIRLIEDYDGKVPNDRRYLESLPGVGHKTCNVVLSELFNIPTMAVDTHVERVAKRLKLVDENDNIKTIETKLEKSFDKNHYTRINHQLLLFGRYICTAKNPKCEKCLIKCNYEKTKNL